MRRLLLCCLCLLLVFPCAASAQQHILTTMMNQGTCRKLVGEVYLKVLLVDTPEAQWSSAAGEAFRAQTDAAAAVLEAEADRYGISLALEAEYLPVQVGTEYDSADSWPLVEEALMAVPGLAVDALKSISGQQELPVLICLPNPGRSMAYSVDEKDIEYAIVFSDSDSASIAHELLHLFGARDFYLHQEVKAAALDCFPGSIMLDCKESSTVDSFTAWCIGWTEAPDAMVERFLHSTAHLSQESLDEAYEQSIYTGFATRESEESIYTGMLVDGLFHGAGICRWKSGETYTGQWVNGKREGYGVFTHPDGAVYTGAHADNQRTGKGILTWPDGTCYMGDFDQNAMTGTGILTWPDGGCYIGGFLDGQYHGQGAYTAPDGSVVTGTWECGVSVE